MTLNQPRRNFTRGKQLVGTAALALGFAAILAPHGAHAATHITRTHMVSTHSRFDSSCIPTYPAYPPCDTSAPGANGYPPTGSNGYAPTTTSVQVPGDATAQTPVVVQQPPTAPVNIVLTPISIDVPQQSLPPILVQPAQTTFNVTPPQITVNLPAPAQQTIYFAPNPAPVVQYGAPPAINFVPSTQPQLPPIILPATPVAVPSTIPTGYTPATQGPCDGNNQTPSYPNYGNNQAPSYPSCSNSQTPSYPNYSNNDSTPCPTWSNSSNVPSCPAWSNSNDSVPCPPNW